jgi:hypothetical protein
LQQRNVLDKWAREVLGLIGLVAVAEIRRATRPTSTRPTENPLAGSWSPPNPAASMATGDDRVAAGLDEALKPFQKRASEAEVRSLLSSPAMCF